MKAKFAGAIIMSLVAFQVRAEDLTIRTPRGTDLNVTIDRPMNANGQHPTLVIAPGQGYHKELPLIKSLAAKASAAGAVVYRFDWAYYSIDPKSGEPSVDLKNEIEDMQAVIDQAKKDKSVDSARMLLAGKSLGTLVSYQIFNTNKDYLGLILMTPLCTDPDTNADIGNESYPDFAKNDRPIAMILGNTDPMCKLPALYDFTRASKSNVTINVFNGGHSLTIGAPGATAFTKINDANLNAATTAAALWAQVMTTK